MPRLAGHPRPRGCPAASGPTSALSSSEGQCLVQPDYLVGVISSLFTSRSYQALSCPAVTAAAAAGRGSPRGLLLAALTSVLDSGGGPGDEQLPRCAPEPQQVGVWAGSLRPLPLATEDSALV